MKPAYERCRRRQRRRPRSLERLSNMLASQVVVTTGVIVAIGGLVTEMVAVASMASYPLRRVLPVQSPLTLVSIGCNSIIAEITLYLIGRFLGRSRLRCCPWIAENKSSVGRSERRLNLVA